MSIRKRHGVKALESERQVTAMLYGGNNEWDEFPEADDCELICSFLELVYAMVMDIQHLKAEAIRRDTGLSWKRILSENRS